MESILFFIVVIAIVLFIEYRKKKPKNNNQPYNRPESWTTYGPQYPQNNNSTAPPLSGNSPLDYLYKHNYNHPEQIKKQYRAYEIVKKGCNFDPFSPRVAFSTDNGDGQYFTSNISCTCPSFTYTHQPCKHMYALADLRYMKANNTSILPDLPSISESNSFSNKGFVDARIIPLQEIEKEKCTTFIAFDTETTGFSSKYDRIVEIGAVVFQDGIVKSRFSSLLNVHQIIPPEATEVNHITQEMINSAPEETEVYKAFVEFLGDAMNGKTYLCAHNASFDMRFLSNAFERLGYDATLSFVDTLQISRRLLPNLENHKQGTVAEFFGFQNKNAHRAESDAIVCGKIFIEMLDISGIKSKKTFHNQIEENTEVGVFEQI